MAAVNRENSGYVCKVDDQGRWVLHLDGKPLPGVVQLQTENKADDLGTMSITILTRFVTFEHEPPAANASRNG